MHEEAHAHHPKMIRVVCAAIAAYQRRARPSVRAATGSITIDVKVIISPLIVIKVMRRARLRGGDDGTVTLFGRRRSAWRS